MNWVNSPTFAYQAIFHKLPDVPLRGRTDSPKKTWNNIEIDEHLRDEWLEELNSIPEIEIRASDEGKNKERVAFVVFRMKDPKDDCKVKAVSDGLNKIKGVVKDELKKLDLKEFKQTGLDDDLKDPLKRWRELLADLRYLFNSGYPKLKKGEKWGEWDLTTLLKYGAKIIDTLRTKCYFTLIPPKIGEEKFRSSYWKAYREAREKKYIKTKPPAEKDIKEWDKKREEIIKEKQVIAKFKFLKVDRKEFIVGGCCLSLSRGGFAGGFCPSS